MTDPFRCSNRSDERRESLAGTASTVRAFLLIEVPGSWGVDAVRDNRLPGPVKAELAARANRHGVRLLMIRRHGRSTPCDTVFAAYADPANPWLETACLAGPADLLDLDLAELVAGRSPGLMRPHTSPLFLVCTHGKHDVCCAERGRPVAAALHEIARDDTWEVSHIGGDRFAGNVLVLPDGLYYGRLSPAAAAALAGSQNRGHLDLEHLRGRCGYPFPVQAAEVFLRGELDCTAIGALTLTARSRRGGQTEAVFTDGSRSWTVLVDSTETTAEQLTCRAPTIRPSAVHNLRSISSV